jgi:hypothetical protein
MSRAPPRRRGAMLLEVMLSLALFVGAATFCIAVTRSLFSSLDQAGRRHFAADIARSKLAELEAGMTSIQDLRGEWRGNVGSRSRDASALGQTAAPRWQLDVRTSPSPFRGLALVELTVSEDPAVAPDPVGFTLRQLMALREQDVEAYQADELSKGTPSAAALESTR